MFSECLEAPLNCKGDSSSGECILRVKTKERLYVNFSYKRDFLENSTKDDFLHDIIRKKTAMTI
ncbi:hypothetical protein E2C01_066986 [Portunus trituberculatus]|uniref:Uncharacterized protein n=1 Tax=Portunus trituberculatus TaxID=210409 RepID=A0A5B7HWA0_PORTR|nr:hypothetical protein [Portunus trituberculatus]